MAQADNTMAMYIFKLFASRPSIIMSWGFAAPRAIENGLRFLVNGFKHQGWCEVVYDEGVDTFTFRAFSDEKVAIEKENLYLDNLVDAIDRAVESGEYPKEYKQEVEEWLKTCPR